MVPIRFLKELDLVPINQSYLCILKYMMYFMFQSFRKLSVLQFLPQLHHNIHHVYHVSKLQKAKGTSIPALALRPHAMANHPMVQYLSILGLRVVFQHGKQVDQFLIQWQGLPPEETSWENVRVFRQTYPNYNLEEKVVLNPGE